MVGLIGCYEHHELNLNEGPGMDRKPDVADASLIATKFLARDWPNQLKFRSGQIIQNGGLGSTSNFLYIFTSVMQEVRIPTV